MTWLRTIILACLSWTSTILAGTGPETTLLVVNADSPLSLTVANQWMALRDIPGSHVVWLHDIPTLETLSMAQFQEKILQPIERFLQQHDLVDSIDTVVYSADFPFAVDIRPILKKNGIPSHRYLGSAGSLTGLTFFGNQVLANRADFLNLQANGYFRRQLHPRSVVTKLSKEDAALQKQARKALKNKNALEAKRLFSKLLENYARDPNLRVSLAEALAMLGQHQAALDQLEAAYRAGWDNGLRLRNDKWLGSLKKTEGFRRLIHKIETPRGRFEPPLGFRGRYHWARRGVLGANDFDRYRLSALLAYTGQRGNSLGEIEDYLSRASSSDGTHPKGTVYLMENHDVRTESRQPWFGETCALLRSIGHRCRILTRGRNGEDGVLPKKRHDIIGLTAGTRHFYWKRSGSQMLPGAFADSFTSYAGDFDNKSQTKLTEFLRNGAAGSSGAVVEPYSFAEKFPLPLIHYYYALGYSLAESWYMSVATPYQTILVGDPLAQPFADPVKLSLVSHDPHRPWRGTVHLRLKTLSEKRTRLDHYELWVDGKLVAESTPEHALTWDTTGVSDGYHELHLVAVEPKPREGRTSRRYWIRVDNHQLVATLAAENRRTAFHTPFILTGTAPAGSRISIHQGSRELLALTSKSSSWEAILPTTPLGMGRVTLQAKVTTPQGMEITSNPLQLTVTRARQLAGLANTPYKEKGLLAVLIYSDDKGHLGTARKVVKALDGRLGRLLEKGKKLEQAAFIGHFQVTKPGFHQLSIRTRGAIEVEVDGQHYTGETPNGKQGMIFLPLFLNEGWHRIELRSGPRAVEELEVLLSGESIPMPLGTQNSRCATPSD